MTSAILGVLVLGFSWCSAAESCKLEYNHRPGSETRHKLDATIRFRTDMGGQRQEGEMKMDGGFTSIVAEKDEQTGVALLGQLFAMKLRVNAKTPTGERNMTEERAMVSASRMDRLGQRLPYEQRDDLNRFATILLRQLSEGNASPVRLPGRTVRVGESWDAPMLMPLPGMSAEKDVKATLESIREIDGRSHASIRKELASSQTTPGGEAGGLATETEVSGEMVTLFDLARSVPVETRLKATVKMTFQGGESRTDLEMTTRLESYRMLAEPALAAHAKRIGGLEKAIGQAFLGEFDDALGRIESLQADEADADWKHGIEKTAGTLEQIQRMSRSSAPAPPRPGDGD